MFVRLNNRRGATTIEMTLVGIPMIFALISTFELARGMWNYHTLAYAVKNATLYAAVRGQGCTYTGNTCGVTVANVAQEIANEAIGLPAGSLNITLTSTAGSVTCNPVTSCYSNNNTWPPNSGTANVPDNDIEITGQYAFYSALSMLWPGAGVDRFGEPLYLPAYSRQKILF